MKNLSFLIVVVALSLGMVACGNKDKGGSSSKSFSSDPYKASTVRGYVVPQGRLFVVIASNSAIVYSISPNADMEMQRAFTAAPGVMPRAIPVPAQMANSGQQIPTSGYLADLTGSVVGQQVGIQSGYNPQAQQGTGGMINVTRAVIHR